MVVIVGGNKLEATLAEIASKLQKATKLEVGFLDKATYPDGTLVAAVAAYNEFGTEHIPPRPFFRNMVKANSAKWPVNLKTALKRYDCDTALALGLVGQKIQEELQTSILTNIPPPNAEATAKAKGFNRTLINTGVLINSVGNRVDGGSITKPKKAYSASSGKLKSAKSK